MVMTDAFKKMTTLSTHSIGSLQDIITNRSYAKGEHLLRLGNVDYDFHYIVEGSARVYYLHNGEDITDYFALDGEFIGGLESLFTGNITHKAIELTENSIVESFNYQEFEILCEKYHDVERLGRKIITKLFIMAQEVVEDLRFLSAAQRYEQIEKRHPGISNRIPLKHIASYLNISQVSLSRIRAGKQ